MKAVLQGKFIALNTYIRKEQRSKINNLSFHIRKLERKLERKAYCKPGKTEKKKIIKIRAKINEIENKDK